MVLCFVYRDFLKFLGKDFGVIDREGREVGGKGEGCVIWVFLRLNFIFVRFDRVILGDFGILEFDIFYL